MHLKLLKNFTAEPFAFHPLGRGTVDLPGVIAVLGDAGYDGWATIELNEFAGPPAEAATESLRYLEPLLAARGAE